MSETVSDKKIWSVSCDRCMIHRQLIVAALKTETQRCQNAVGSFEAHIGQIPRLRGMIEVERQKSNTLQAEVLRLGANYITLKLGTGRKKRLCSNTRERKDISQELEWMCLQENESGATGGGRVGTADTTLIE